MIIRSISEYSSSIMIMRKLPPFSAMRAFEAAARLGSFKAAAQELSVTPTAISHQIRQLEQHSGSPLFVRQTRKVSLTQEGKAFFDNLNSSFDSIASAYENLCRDTRRQQVTLGGGPLIASRWLLKRLPGFWSLHPEIDLWLHHSPLPVWRQIDQYDLAIAWGNGQWPNVEAFQLLDVEVTPVVSPLMITDTALHSPHDLLDVPLLHYRSTDGWKLWFRTTAVDTPNTLPGTVFEDANILLQAAISNRGAALGFLPLIAEDLETGKLIRPFKSSIRSNDAYYLIRQKKGSVSLPARTTWNWLASQVAS